jgi:hypothetical protein
MISIARTLGAPDTVPAERGAARPAVEARLQRASTLLTMCITQ